MRCHLHEQAGLGRRLGLEVGVEHHVHAAPQRRQLLDDEARPVLHRHPQGALAEQGLLDARERRVQPHDHEAVVRGGVNPDGREADRLGLDAVEAGREGEVGAHDDLGPTLGLLALQVQLEAAGLLGHQHRAALLVDEGDPGLLDVAQQPHRGGAHLAEGDALDGGIGRTRASSSHRARDLLQRLLLQRVDVGLDGAVERAGVEPGPADARADPPAGALDQRRHRDARAPVATTPRRLGHRQLQGHAIGDVLGRHRAEGVAPVGAVGGRHTSPPVTTGVVERAGLGALLGVADLGLQDEGDHVLAVGADGAGARRGPARVPGSPGMVAQLGPGGVGLGPGPLDGAVEAPTITGRDDVEHPISTGIGLPALDRSRPAQASQHHRVQIGQAGRLHQLHH